MKYNKIWSFKSVPVIFSVQIAQRFVSGTLLAEDNQASVSAMLNTILEKPMTPMEAKQAKSYMEQVATQAANDEGAEVQLFQRWAV